MALAMALAVMLLLLLLLLLLRSLLAVLPVKPGPPLLQRREFSTRSANSCACFAGFEQACCRRGRRVTVGPASMRR